MNSGLTVAVQRMPGGRSASKSNTHSRSLAQRPVPLEAAASLQLMTSGAGALGSPKVTAAASNLATAWRTRATSPCGLKLTICNACACAANSNPPTSAVVARAFLQSVFIVFITLACKGYESLFTVSQGSPAKP